PEVWPDVFSLPPSELRRVGGFRIRRRGVGEIAFEGEVDFASQPGLLEDLTAIVHLEMGEVVLYPGRDKPREGTGLNRPATVTLFQCFPPEVGQFPDAESKARYRGRIAQMTEEKGAHFVDYDCDTGTWRFQVDHF
ncbi:unnamed protein product, partial [Prorocentrum cordatum]